MAELSSLLVSRGQTYPAYAREKPSGGGGGEKRSGHARLVVVVIIKFWVALI